MPGTLYFSLALQKKDFNCAQTLLALELTAFSCCCCFIPFHTTLVDEKFSLQLERFVMNEVDRRVREQQHKQKHCL